MPQPLSSKEGSLFRQLIRNYDSKQYKKGLKAAEQILRKTPDHGDTIAMKALIINSLGRSEEAFTLAKAALRIDMKSHVCWHVYGLLYRSANNFEEAIKAYRFALKLEPESPQIQRDLAFLQMQMRDYQGYMNSRLAMVQARPGLRQNWSALAIAHHLSGDFFGAEGVLTTYENTLRQPPPRTDVEHSEALLYKNYLIASQEKYEKALEHLEAVNKHILDRTSFLERKADYLLRLSRNEDAEAAYRLLIGRNPENRAYYDGLRLSLKIEETDRQAILELYQSYAKKEPRADAPFRIPLNHLEGTEFREAADRYLRRMLGKGVPSTFANLKGLYIDTDKKETIRKLVEGYASSDDDTPINNSAGTEDKNGPSNFKTSALFFLAQHYNYHLSRDLAKALDYIDQGLKRAPDSVDYHMVKARIWKHSGNPQKASDTMEHARTLDERDRYINSKTSKYQLRNHENREALRTMSKFTRNDTAGGALGDLHDMQCMWYLTEDGESCARQGKLGLALKRYHAIYDIFEVWQEDQFDFHNFSLRKGQLQAYIEMLRWEDQLLSHPFYSRVAIHAIRTYVFLHDQARLPNNSLSNGVRDGEDGEAANGRRKAVKKAKREQQKKEKADEGQTPEGQSNSNGKSSSKGLHKVEIDPEGTKFLENSDPLKDAMKFLRPLLEFCPDLVETQIVAFEVFVRRSKYLLALRCLHAAYKLDRDHPILHQQIMRFHRQVDSIRSSLPEKLSGIFMSIFDFISESTSAIAYNESFLSRYSDDGSRIHAALRVRRSISPDTQAQNERDLLNTLDLDGLPLEEARQGLVMFREWKGGDGQSEVIDEYERKARARWPHSTVFDRDALWDRPQWNIINSV